MDDGSEVDDEISGVDDETTGVSDETTGVDNDGTTGVDDDETTGADDETNDEDEDAVDKDTTRMAGRMKLRPQPRKEYNVFNINGEEEMEHIVMLQLDRDGELDEIDALDAEYMFLTETLGWKEGLNDDEAKKEISEANVKYLAEYLFVTEQMGWKQGLKIFQEKGEEAIQKELQQIHDIQGFKPRHWHELTKEERASALKYLMYLKEKRDGRIKGRGCADGRPQRLHTTKMESSSPTASLAGLVMTCVIDAYERRDVATCDIPGAFLQAKLPPGDKKLQDQSPVTLSTTNLHYAIVRSWYDRI